MGITRQQASDCFASDDLIGIGMEADAVRRRLHPENVVSYTIDRAFNRALDRADRDDRALQEWLSETVSMGATGLLLQDSEDQSVPLDRYELLLAEIKQRFPALRLHGLSATRILSLAATAQVPLRDAMSRLRDAGLDGMDSNAVIFDDAIRRRVTPNKCSTSDWIEVHRTAHKLGVRTTATMVFGVGETVAQRVGHLEILRNLQQETGGFTAFTPLAYQDGVAIALSTAIAEPTAVEYLKTLAVSRLYLDNIANLQGSWGTQGLKVLQMGLRFGGNDVGSVFLDERSGRPGGATEEELRRVIREAGFKPAQRDATYSTLFLN